MKANYIAAVVVMALAGGALSAAHAAGPVGTAVTGADDVGFAETAGISHELVAASPEFAPGPVPFGTLLASGSLTVVGVNESPVAVRLTPGSAGAYVGDYAVDSGVVHGHFNSSHSLLIGIYEGQGESPADWSDECRCGWYVHAVPVSHVEYIIARIGNMDVNADIYRVSVDASLWAM